MVRYAALLCLFGTLGCSDLFGTDRDLTVVSDASSYRLGQDARFTMTNVSNRTIKLHACSAGARPQPTGEIDRRDGGWVEIDGFGGRCLAVTTPVDVDFAPGQSMEFGFHLGHQSHVGTLRVRVVREARILGISNSFSVSAQ